MSTKFHAVYRLTFDDYNRLCEAQKLWLPAWRQFKSFDLAINTVLLGFAGLLLWSGDYLYGGLMLALAAGLLLLDLVGVPWSRRNLFEQQRLGSGKVVLAADDHGFRIDGEHTKSQSDWSAVVRVDRLDAHTVLWTGKKMGIIVPDRAFDEAGQAHAFSEFAKEKASGQIV